MWVQNMPLVNSNSTTGDHLSSEAQKLSINTPQSCKNTLAQASLKVISCLAFNHQMGIDDHREAADKLQIKKMITAILPCFHALNRIETHKDVAKLKT